MKMSAKDEATSSLQQQHASALEALRRDLAQERAQYAQVKVEADRALEKSRSAAAPMHLL